MAEKSKNNPPNWIDLNESENQKSYYAFLVIRCKRINKEIFEIQDTIASANPIEREIKLETFLLWIEREQERLKEDRAGVENLKKNARNEKSRESSLREILNCLVTLDFHFETTRRLLRNEKINKNLFSTVKPMSITQRALAYALCYKERYEGVAVENTIPQLANIYGLSKTSLRSKYKEYSGIDSSIRIYTIGYASKNKRSRDTVSRALTEARELLKNWNCSKAAHEIELDIAAVA